MFNSADTLERQDRFGTHRTCGGMHNVTLYTRDQIDEVVGAQEVLTQEIETFAAVNIGGKFFHTDWVIEGIVACGDEMQHDPSLRIDAIFLKITDELGDASEGNTEFFIDIDEIDKGPIPIDCRKHFLDLAAAALREAADRPEIMQRFYDNAADRRPQRFPDPNAEHRLRDYELV